MNAYPDRRRIERRSRMPSMRYPERRRGFDRRTPPRGAFRRRYHAALGWYRRTPAALAVALILIAALNVADLALTHRALEQGAVELNPVMAQLFAAGGFRAAIFKLSVGLVVVAAIWRLRRYRRMLEASVVVLVLLGTLVGYQVTTGILG